jgi:hypothetical protein
MDMRGPSESMPGQPQLEELPSPTGRLPASPSSAARRSSGEFNTRSTPTVTGLVINRRHSVGHDIDGIPGDEGIHLLVQPLSPSGQPLLAAGELTVTISEERPDGRVQQVGYWKFLPDETELFFTADDFEARGILLHLPWDQELPTTDQIRVEARYRSAQSAPLIAQATILIQPPTTSYSPEDPLIAGWSQRDSRWSSSGTQAGPGNQTPARPASTGGTRIQKPRWRPVR